jgi:hypothetical protein
MKKLNQQSLFDFVIECSGSNVNFVKQDKLAEQVLKQKCIVPVLKVTRAGATTSLVKQALNSGKRELQSLNPIIE